MKMKNIAAVALAAVALGAPLAATASDGDIIEIRAVDVPGTITFGARNSMSPYKCTADHPLVAGDTLYIRVRMLVRNATGNGWKLIQNGSVEPQTWSFHEGALGGGVMYLPKLGIFVGDRKAYATYSDYGPNSWQVSGELQYDDAGNATSAYRYYTDFYFAYDVQPGDIGLPVTLMNSAGEKASSSDDNTDYYLLNCDTTSNNHYVLKDTAGNVASFHYANLDEFGGDWPPGGGTVAPLRNFDLVAEGAYVKTVDFDYAYVDDGAGIWREVYPGMSDSPGAQPSIIIPNGLVSAENTTVWIWSEDETVVVPYGDTQTITYEDEHGNTQTRQALPVTIPASDSTRPFRLKGADSAAVGATASICMSATRTPEYTPSGAEIQAVVRRTIRVKTAPEPTVSIYLDDLDPTKTVTATPDYVTCNTKLAIRMTPTCPSPVTVSLNAAVSGDDTLGTLGDLFDANILRIAPGNYGGDPLDQEETSVTIPENTSVVYLNVYVLGGTSRTGTKGVTFSLTKTSGPDSVSVNGSCTLKINRSTPTIVASDPEFTVGEDVGTISVISGGWVDFALELADSYRDLYDDDTGYTFKWACDGEDIDDHEGVVMDGDGLFVGSAQFWNITDGKELTLCVVNPDGRTSAKVKYNLVVSDSKKTTVSFTDPGRMVFAEGETAYLNLGLTQPYKGTGYIFIDADSQAALDNVTTTLKTEGAQIDQGKTQVATPRAVKFEDGDRDMTLKAVLCSANDITKKVTTYVAGTVSFTVTNKPPTLTSLNCAGTYMTPDMRGTTISVPRGVAKRFSVAAKDVDPDLNATGDDAFQVEWTIDGQTYYTKGNPNSLSVTHEFKNVKPAAPVYVKMKDKDMDWPTEPDFFFYVEVREKPFVKISTDAYGSSDLSGTFWESSSGHTITITLSDEASADVNVRLKVQQASDGGYVKLREVEGMVEAAKDGHGDAIPGEYDVTFTSGALTRTIRVSEMDGTDGTANGLTVDAAVTTETMNPEGVAWKDYYTPAETYLLVIENDWPMIKRPSMLEVASTNENASAGTPYKIYYAASDVPADLTNSVLPGLAVDISVDGTSVLSTNVLDTVARWVEVEFDGAGVHYVTVTFTDKDGMSSDRTMYFFVQPNKTLELRAHGPAVAVASNTGDSQKYSVAAGLGAGRVWAGENGPKKIVNFVHTYSVGKEQTAITAYAYAYKADGKYDDGTLLPAPDKGIDEYGTWTDGQTIENFYNYTLQHTWGSLGYDSFLYAWSCNNVDASTSGGSSTTSKQFLFNMGEYGEMAIPLPSDESKKEQTAILSYPKQYWEAIFSREYLKTDNCGDINADGIPDIVLYRYGLGVLNMATHEIMSSGSADDEGDLADVSGYNDDVVTTTLLASGGGEAESAAGDALPVVESSIYSSLIPGLPAGWSESDFTARLELRGYASGLNDAMTTLGFDVKSDRVYAEEVDGEWAWTVNCTIDSLEFKAWLNYAASHGLDWTNSVDWAKWSPERPTSPIKDDTDGDKMPDGYEYFFWYRAHVGYIDNGVHKYLTGRKYDPRNPGTGKFISSAAIALAMDPRSDLAPVDFPSDDERISTSSTTILTRDIDNDGLPDLLELVIGTNPFDFDTDGDGLPDGFEIQVAGTDPLLWQTVTGICDAMRNYDGDAMAYTSPEYEKDHVVPAPKHIKSLTSFALVDRDGDTDGVQWYVMPTDEAPTLEEDVEYVNDAEGYIVHAGGVAYVTKELPSFVSSVEYGANVVRLAADLPPESTWTANMVDADDGAKLVMRLMPTRLVAGTVLDREPDVSEPIEYGYLSFRAEVVDSMTAWPYGRSDVPTVTTGGNLANQGGFGFLALGRYKNAPSGVPIASLPAEDKTIAYLHHQVYQEFGFDPRTAWNANTPIGARWGKSIDGIDEDGFTTSEAKLNNLGMYPYVGIATRTRDYTLYDEFLLMSFFLNGGAPLDVVPTVLNPWYKIWSRYTTNGRGPGEADLKEDNENYEGREAIDGSPMENGADTDADGVPDGWELYVMSGPKRYDKDKEKYYFRFPAPYDDGNLSAFGPFEPLAKNASYTDNNATSGYETAAGDNDGLTEYQEFAGTDTTLYYADFSTTITRPDEHAKWINKFFPTDPWNSDTDGDGVDDKQEGSNNGKIPGGNTGFIYGTPVDNVALCTIPGGGLNPLSVDTDYDGIPDGWEKQFNGGKIYDGPNPQYASGLDATTGLGNPMQGLVDGMDGTVPDAYDISNGSLDEDGSFVMNTGTRGDGAKMFGEVNRDYDCDGLENWQEYLSGTMRCWRYDDILTGWDGIPEELYWDENGNFSPDYEALGVESEGEFWYRTLVDKTSPIYNPRLISGQTTGAQYFSLVTNVWDLAYMDDSTGGAYYYFKDRIGDMSLKDLWAEPFLNEVSKAGSLVTKPNKYISCSPLEADSDRDGMDDYYELFHGMNPLLGASGVTLKNGGPCDVVYDAWHADGSDTIFEAWNLSDPKANIWTYKVGKGEYYKTGEAPRGTGYDFEYFPWLNGLATADPDGDDIRNQSEAIMPKLATSTWHHTDPTPLWMTDTSYDRSLVRLYFRMPGRDNIVPTPGDSFEYDGVTYDFIDFGGWMPAAMFIPPRFVPCSQDLAWGLYGAGLPNWIFSFEENEGYDSDHDAMSDFDEAKGELRTASDPQDANSPNRRQAMYFAGPASPSALQTPLPVAEQHPVAIEDYPDEMTFFKFTVEAWAMAESLADATIVERAIWCDPSKAGDEELVRKNFQLGVKSGRWYARFDANGTLGNSSVELLSAEPAEAGVWHHIAATYDGSRFTLYVDGQEAAIPRDTSLQPEYGSSAVVVHRSFSENSQNKFLAPHVVGDYWRDTEYALRTIVVGASLKTQAEGGSEKSFDVYNASGWDGYTRFFTGYVDEIRIWDGARAPADILADVAARKRYTRDDAIDNRSAFFKDWSTKGNRYQKDDDGEDINLVPELVHHFSFDSVPGGADAQAVAKAPGGFDCYQPAALGGVERGAAVLSRPVDWNVSWWAKMLEAYGSVYSSDQWVQWVPDTVAHLPRFDGTTLDSFFWSDNTCGGTNGTYRFARNAEPASRWVQLYYADLVKVETFGLMYYKAPGFRHHLISDMDGVAGEAATNSAYNASSRWNLFRFTGRHLLQDGSDLLPLGGAFAKSCPVMWDGQGAATAWEVTGGDSDGNGLPDIWEEYAVANYSPRTEPLTWETIVTWTRPGDGTKFDITAGEAYRRDLASGRVVASNDDGDLDVVLREDLRQTADEDFSKTPDWWDDIYGVYGVGGATDSDNDGLSNYMEYLASECFPFGLALNPKMPRSDAKTLDYFRRIGSLYLGEMFTDHDQMEDWWEREADSDTIDPNVWDAQRDGDEDGWTNFDELRYNEWCQSTLAQLISHAVGDFSFLDAPKPAIKLTARYNGNRSLDSGNSLPTLHVFAYTDDDMARPDAEFSVQPGETVTREFYMGGWEDRVVRGTLDPGNIEYGSVDLEYTQLPQDDMYSWLDGNGTLHLSRPYSEFKEALRLDPAIIQNVSTFAWSHLLPPAYNGATADRAVTVSSGGQIAIYGERVGKIDLITGDFEFDMAALDNLTLKGFYEGSEANAWGLKEAIYKLTYTAKVPATQYYKVTASLVQPESGFVKGGKNSFFAYWDVDGDGAYTPGTDPCGMVRDVDIGWREREVEIELTETSAVTPRIKLWLAGGGETEEGANNAQGGGGNKDTADSASDRAARFGESVVTTNAVRYVPVDPSSMPAATRIRVVRYIVDTNAVWRLPVTPEVVFDGRFENDVRDFIHEGDFIGGGKFDIDWDKLESDVYNNYTVIRAGLDVTNMTYAIVVGDGDVAYLGNNDKFHNVYVLPYMVTRRFEKTHTPPTAVAENGDSVCRVARPTFRWKIENEDPWASAFGTTYTAFRVVVKNAAGKEVYNSGYQRMPAADSSGVYSWTAPLYVDSPSPSGSHLVFANLSNYTWQVFTYNAKFKTDSVGTASKAFRMNVTDADMSSYGFDVDVCYAGPAANLADRIRVQAFESPDFSGYPVAEAVVTNVAREALDASAGSRVRIKGLKAGTYFVRAYIDTDYDWKLDDWESWGYLCERDRAAVVGTKKTFNFSSVTVGPEMAEPVVRKLFIEDRDTDGDCFPDVWEAEQNGNKFVIDSTVPVTGDAELIAVNKDLAATLSKQSQGYVATAVSALSSARGLAMMSGLSVDKAASMLATGVLPASVVDGTVEITSFAFDRSTGEVVLGVGAETAPEGVDPAVASLYALSVPRGATVKVKVYRTETLAGNWALVAEETLTVDPSGAEIRAPLSTAVDTSSGFFKVEVEQ